MTHLPGFSKDLGVGLINFAVTGHVVVRRTIVESTAQTTEVVLESSGSYDLDKLLVVPDHTHPGVPGYLYVQSGYPARVRGGSQLALRADRISGPV